MPHCAAGSEWPCVPPLRSHSHVPAGPCAPMHPPPAGPSALRLPWARAGSRCVAMPKSRRLSPSCAPPQTAHRWQNAPTPTIRSAKRRRRSPPRRHPRPRRSRCRRRGASSGGRCGRHCAAAETSSPCALIYCVSACLRLMKFIQSTRFICGLFLEFNMHTSTCCFHAFSAPLLSVCQEQGLQLKHCRLQPCHCRRRRPRLHCSMLPGRHLQGYHPARRRLQRHRPPRRRPSRLHPAPAAATGPAAPSPAALWGAAAGPGWCSAQSGRLPPAAHQGSKGLRFKKRQFAGLQGWFYLTHVRCRPLQLCCLVCLSRSAEPTCGHSSPTTGGRRAPRRGRSPVTICSGGAEGLMAWQRAGDGWRATWMAKSGQAW